MINELRKKRAGLVLEGGASRGVFTAGALDYLMEQEFDFPYAAGVSAGACNALSYVSGQKGRSFACFAPARKEDQYKNTIREAIRQRSYYDMDKLFETFQKETFPYDFDAYLKKGQTCEMVVTNVYTGKAEYLSERKSLDRLSKICRASASLPLFSQMVMIDGVPYLDGGIADSVPLVHAVKRGIRKPVLILTRQRGYRKKFPSKRARMYIAFFHDYPNLVKRMYYRPYFYNRTMDLIERLEMEKKIFVLRPTLPCPSRTEMDHEKLQAFYQHGYNSMVLEYDHMRSFLGV